MTDLEAGMGVVEVGVIAAQVQLHIEQIAGHCLECFACRAQIHLHVHKALGALHIVGSRTMSPISGDAANQRQDQSMICRMNVL